MKEERKVPVLNLYGLIKEMPLSFEDAYQFIECEMECKEILESHGFDYEDNAYERLMFRLMHNHLGLNKKEIEKRRYAELRGSAKWSGDNKKLFDVSHDLLMIMRMNHLENDYPVFYQDTKMMFQCDLYLLLEEYKKIEDEVLQEKLMKEAITEYMSIEGFIECDVINILFI